MNREILKQYIKGYATQAEKDEVAAWTKADKDHLKELFVLRKLYDVTVWQREKNTLNSNRRRKSVRLYKAGAVAAVILLLLISNGYTYHINRKTPDVIMQTLRVPAGQRAELTLADGTNVWLNAGSTLSFPNYFKAGKREVSLDGEGYFDVEKDVRNPFIVKTGKYHIEVSGTEFNVLAYSKSSLFEVSLLNGTVDVCTGDRRTGLQPNEKLYLSADRLLKEPIQNYDYLLWKNGLICFDDESVDLMVSKLELYFDMDIIVENPSFMKRKYTGKFRTKDGIEHILKVFQLKDNFLYEKDDENNLITIK
jgi:ferric-dicitrate binding protein FerR (iron transport regulator)